MRTTQFHATLIDECGDEFGVSFKTTDRDSAYDYLAEQYPESRVSDLASTAMVQDRQADRESRLMAEIDGDW